MATAKTTAMVTGASSGLGEEFCRQLAPRCDVIIAVARRLQPLQLLAKELADVCEVHPVQADLVTVEGVTQAMEALRQLGPADILVNNAGFSPFGQFAESAIDQQRAMISLHCDAVITLCRAATPFMREAGAGYIVNVSSLSALIPSKGMAVYGASKAFLNFFSESLQQELQDTGIRVQALCPGFTRTEFHDKMAAKGFDRERIAADMWMEPADVVAASLAALEQDKVVVVPGQTNQDLARAALEHHDPIG